MKHDPDGGNVYRHTWSKQARIDCGYPEETREQTLARLQRQRQFHHGLEKEIKRLEGKRK